MNAIAKFDNVQYGRLLAKTQPALIQNDKELDRLSAIALKLAVKPNKTAAEERLQDLLDDLIMRYENEHHAIDTSDLSPVDMLKFLIEESSTTPAALARDMNISRGILGDILKGRRDISKAIAKALAVRFKVSPVLFI